MSWNCVRWRARIQWCARGTPTHPITPVPCLSRWPSRNTQGRAGRAGIDSIGEAYICVTKGLLDRAIKLITAKLSPVVSQVKDISKVALQAIASGLATKRNHVCLMMRNLLLFSSARASEKQSLMQAILREVKWMSVGGKRRSDVLECSLFEFVRIYFLGTEFLHIPPYAIDHVFIIYLRDYPELLNKTNTHLLRGVV